MKNVKESISSWFFAVIKKKKGPKSKQTAKIESQEQKHIR